MFDDNHIDQMMKSILENGQEEVPARVWNGISEGLDRMERRKSVVLWFRRAGVAAAAAAVAVGVIMNMGQEDELVPSAADSQMIAVVEPEHIAPEGVTMEDAKVLAKGSETTAMEGRTLVPERDRLLAYAEPEVYVSNEASSAEPDETTPVIPDETSPIISPNTASVIPSEASPVIPDEVEGSPHQGTWSDDETELKYRQLKASLVISGIAGTNNPQNRDGIAPMRSPAMEKHYTRTTVEQTGKDIIYGIPLSFGVGAKLHFTERWSLGMGLNYSLLTSRFDGKYIEVSEEGLETLPKQVQSQIRNTQHYIGIPINVYYNIINRDFINFYAYAGGTVEKCVRNNYEIMTVPAIYHHEDVKGVQISANAGIGVEFMLGRYVGLYIDPSLRYYFRNGQPKSIRTAQPLMLGFEMGFRFNL